MARSSGWRSASIVGRRLVEAGVISEAQLNDCTSAAIQVSSDGFPEVHLHLLLSDGQVRHILNGHEDG